MARIAIDQAANALWISSADLAAAGRIGGGRTRHFESVLNAVRFIMEELGPADRATAWITTDEGRITMEEIEAIYKESSSG
jgi:hypothetical protein